MVYVLKDMINFCKRIIVDFNFKYINFNYCCFKIFCLKFYYNIDLY